jgi:Ion channel
MRYSAPWQALVTVLLVQYVLYAFITLAAVGAIWMDLPYASSALLFAAFGVLAYVVPTHLSWSGNAYETLVPAHLFHQAVAVLVYAGHYSRIGLTSPDGTTSMSYGDAIYYSLCTWTTLGASDLFIGKGFRLLAALEALTAVLFVPVFTALVWQMMQAMAPPPGEAFLDRQRAKEFANARAAASMSDID